MIETFRQIFDRLYDNDNKICTKKSLFEQFKQVNRVWLQQKRKEMCLEGHQWVIDELLEELEQ